MRISEKQIYKLIRIVTLVSQNSILNPDDANTLIDLINEIEYQQDDKLITIGELEEVKDGKI